jgi:preprotein translocase subunit SecG
MGVLTIIVIILHVITSLALIALILLHSGKGGGLSDVFGGGMAPASLGGSTLAERNLDRLTVIVGVSFAVTTIVLTWLLAAT